MQNQITLTPLIEISTKTDQLKQVIKSRKVILLNGVQIGARSTTRLKFSAPAK